MSFDGRELVLRAFARVRARFHLGMGECLAALQALEGGFGDTLKDLGETLEILWCHSAIEQSQFEPIWKSLTAGLSAPERTDDRPSNNEPSSQQRQSESEEERSPDISPPPPPLQEKLTSPPPEPQPKFDRVPVQAPLQRERDEEGSLLQAYYPISRRSMAYTWRYLRRPVADGLVDVLDVQETIARATRQGFYLSPVFARRERNDAHLLLFVDRNGSMTPFHRFANDLVETALEGNSLAPENVRVYYFQNVPVESVCRDMALTEPIALQNVFSECTNETSVLVVSDAGAARGFRQMARVRATTRFLMQLKRYTALIAWLNPMPKERWIGSSAEIIAHLVPMFQMDKDGLSNAIDIARGQPLRHFHPASR